MTSDATRCCDVWALAQRRSTARGELAIGALPRLAAELVDAQGTLSFRLEGLIDERGRAAARFELDGVVRQRCDRCGEPVEVPIREAARFFFVADERELAGLPIDDSAEEPLLGSQHFDVTELVEDQAILALPLSPRHERCSARGGQAGDGGDANQRHPFAALAALKPASR
jgi:uncharacterized protein